MRRKSYWVNVFRTSHHWWTLLPSPPTYYRTRCDLFRTSPDYCRHKTSDVSSCLWSIGIITRQHRMGHMHGRNMYQSKRRKVKEYFCDYFIVLLSFESGSVMWKILRWYVAWYVASTHHELRHCWGCLQRHPITPQGQISVEEQRLAQLSGNVTRFTTYKDVVCQSLIGCGAWL